MNKLRIEEETEIFAETKFRTEFEVVVCNKMETDEFIEEKSGNCFRPRRKEEIKTNISMMHTGEKSLSASFVAT